MNIFNVWYRKYFQDNVLNVWCLSIWSKLYPSTDIFDKLRLYYVCLAQISPHVSNSRGIWKVLWGKYTGSWHSSPQECQLDSGGTRNINALFISVCHVARKPVFGGLCLVLVLLFGAWCPMHECKFSGLIMNSGFWGWLSIESQPQNAELGRL